MTSTESREAMHIKLMFLNLFRAILINLHEKKQSLQNICNPINHVHFLGYDF